MCGLCARATSPSATNGKPAANQLIRWHGDRHAILGFADAFVVRLRRLYDCDPVAIIARLAITRGQRDLLVDTYSGIGSG
jgi:hypothetical protein